MNANFLRAKPSTISLSLSNKRPFRNAVIERFPFVSSLFLFVEWSDVVFERYVVCRCVCVVLRGDDHVRETQSMVV